MKNALLIEGSQIKTAVAVGADMGSAQTGARVKLANFEKCLVLVNMAASSAPGAVVQATLKQHNAASGGTSKDLSVLNPHFYKVIGQDAFTKVVPSATRALVDASTQFDTAGGILAIEVRSEDLDNDGGYYWLSVDLADVGGVLTKAVVGMYVLADARFEPAYALATI